jgi:hypothetical protein
MDTGRSQVGRQDFVGDADASSLAPQSRASAAPKPDAARSPLLPMASPSHGRHQRRPPEAPPLGRFRASGLSSADPSIHGDTRAPRRSWGRGMSRGPADGAVAAGPAPRWAVGARRSGSAACGGRLAAWLVGFSSMSGAGRNEPCSCGSGRKFKQSCGPLLDNPARVVKEHSAVGARVQAWAFETYPEETKAGLAAAAAPASRWAIMPTSSSRTPGTRGLPASKSA